MYNYKLMLDLILKYFRLPPFYGIKVEYPPNARVWSLSGSGWTKGIQKEIDKFYEEKYFSNNYGCYACRNDGRVRK